MVLLLFFVGCSNQTPQWLTSYQGEFTLQYQQECFTGQFIRNHMGCGLFEIQQPDALTGFTVTVQDQQIQYTFRDMELQGDGEDFPVMGVFPLVVNLLDDAQKREEKSPDYEDGQTITYRGETCGIGYSITYDKSKNHPTVIETDNGMVLEFTNVSPYEPVG